MIFEVVHLTDYRYTRPASEAYLEARLTPPTRPGQEVLSHQIDFHPATETSNYVDYFGNITTFYTMTLRHERLMVSNRLVVKTSPPTIQTEALSLTIAEARQIFSSNLTDVFDFLQPTSAVPTGGPSSEWAKKFLRSDLPLGVALARLNAEIYERFIYKSGSTEVTTPLSVIWKKRMGVCQDFAHIMLSVLRTAGLPARYVCGYIETAAPVGKKLIGAVATHAWVEVLLPGLQWIAFDPTNNKYCGEQHITVAVGRDFADASPVRGTFKGSGAQTMNVRVTMQRLASKK